MALRRGFQIRQGERVLVLEDVVTTGGSVREVISLVKELGGVVIGVGSLVDRSGGRVDFGVPYKPLLSLDIKTFNAEDCPMCRKGLPVEKPGSRK
jgi:orotate phosphoribosyltransferase